MDLEEIEKRQIVLALLVVAVVGAAGWVIATNHLVQSEGDVPVRTNDGPQITVSGTGDVDYETSFGGNNTVALETEFGNATFYSNQRTFATVDIGVTGTTQLTQINSSLSHLAINPEDKRGINVSGGLDSLSYSSIDLAGNNAELSYSASSSGGIRVRSVTAEEVALVDSSGNVIQRQTTAADETVKFDVSGTVSDATLVAQQDPVITNATPTGQLSQLPSTLSVDISDGEFALFNEEVDVTITHNGNQLTSETITSEQTVDASIGTVKGGTNNWTVSATDTSGATVSKSYSYQAPNELEIRNETSPGNLIKNVSVGIQFFEAGNEGNVYNRNTTDGTINMTGLPVDKSFVAKASAEGYVDRRIFIASLFEQQSIYLLNDSTDYVEVVFDLEDFSGQFQASDTVLEVRRPLASTDTPWRTVEGDRFGATGEFTTSLLRNARHELRVTNVETGISRQLGSFRPTAAGVHTVRVNPDLSVGLQTPALGASFTPGIGKLSAREQNVTVTVDSVGEDLSSYQIQLIYEKNGSSTVLRDLSGSDPEGVRKDFTVNLTNRAGGTLTAVVVGETVDGQTQVIEKEYDITENLANEYSAISWFEKFGNRLGSGVLALLSVFSTAALTGLAAAFAPISSELLGVISLMGLAVFTLVGWLPLSLLFAAGATWAAFAGLQVIR